MLCSRLRCTQAAQQRELDLKTEMTALTGLLGDSDDTIETKRMRRLDSVPAAGFFISLTSRFPFRLERELSVTTEKLADVTSKSQSILAEKNLLQERYESMVHEQITCEFSATES